MKHGVAIWFDVGNLKCNYPFESSVDVEGRGSGC